MQSGDDIIAQHQRFPTRLHQPVCWMRGHAAARHIELGPAT
jgi:hypothetical protein